MKFCAPAILALLTSSALASQTLKGAAADAHKKYFGAALGMGHLANTSDPKFRELAIQQFSGATPENEMKWISTEPFPGVFNFTGGDYIADFAAQHGYTLRGHNLVWDSQISEYVYNLTGKAVEEAMVSHIEGVVKHFKGRVYCWDVVNEPLNDNGTLASSPFYDNLGKSYLHTAYKTARASDPDVKLYINDFNTEGINNKSDAMLSLVRELKKDDLIDGVGFESHFIIGEVPTDLQANLQRFVDAGVEVAITELDIRGTTPLSAADIEQQVKDYQTVASACKAVKGCVGITTWGITDLYSWIPSTFTGQGSALLWDDDYNTVPAYQATIETLTS